MRRDLWRYFSLSHSLDFYCLLFCCRARSNHVCTCSSTLIYCIARIIFHFVLKYSVSASLIRHHQSLENVVVNSSIYTPMETIRILSKFSVSISSECHFEQSKMLPKAISVPLNRRRDSRIFIVVTALRLRSFLFVNKQIAFHRRRWSFRWRGSGMWSIEPKSKRQNRSHDGKSIEIARDGNHRKQLVHGRARKLRKTARSNGAQINFRNERQFTFVRLLESLSRHELVQWFHLRRWHLWCRSPFAVWVFFCFHSFYDR